MVMMPLPSSDGIATIAAPTNTRTKAVVIEFDGSFGFWAFALNFNNPAIARPTPITKATTVTSLATDVVCVERLSAIPPKVRVACAIASPGKMAVKAVTAINRNNVVLFFFISHPVLSWSRPS